MISLTHLARHAPAARQSSDRRRRERSIVAKLGRMLLLVALLSIMGMLGTLHVAHLSSEEAGAINLSGSLRMDVYRLAALTEKGAATRDDASRDALAASAATFERTLRSPRLTRFVPADPHDAHRVAYQAIEDMWTHSARPLFVDPAGGARSGNVLATAQALVSRIDRLVTLLQDDAESGIALLRSIQEITLGGILAVLGFTLYQIRSDIDLPLQDIKAATEKLRRRDWKARARQSPSGDLEGLGRSFNLMAEDLDRLYESLERRIEERTASLQRSNHSLELLYRSIALLYQQPPTHDVHLALLRDLEQTLGAGSGTLCLIPEAVAVDVTLAPGSLVAEGDTALCGRSSCGECHDGDTVRWRTLNGGAMRVISLPLRDSDGRYGVLQWTVPGGIDFEPWQADLLEALAKHLGLAIGARRRIEQRRRWSLHEERAVIARELHDSLAQSLSYLRIQVCRLQIGLQGGEVDNAADILSSIDEGLVGAYRHLRELLSTFRLKAEENFSVALHKTALEYADRGSIQVGVHLDARLPDLSPNEEIHLLQIARESLANAIQHAQASSAEVFLRRNADGSASLVVEDDGVGIDTTEEKPMHYGLQIMQERAAHLCQGRLAVDRREPRGTRVEVRFVPASSAPIQERRNHVAKVAV